MIAQIFDQQCENLIIRAKRNPYFDFERALCFVMESHMQQRLSMVDVVSLSFTRRGLGGGQPANSPLSIAKIFSWPSEELCACLHKFDSDRLYIFDTSEKNLFSIDSTEPMLYSIEQGDRVVILNEGVGRYIDESTLEQLLSRYRQDTNDLLEQEICLTAQVNARGKDHVLPENFVVSIFVA